MRDRVFLVALDSHVQRRALAPLLAPRGSVAVVGSSRELPAALERAGLRPVVLVLDAEQLTDWLEQPGVTASTLTDRAIGLVHGGARHEAWVRERFPGSKPLALGSGSADALARRLESLASGSWP